ncbi:nicotinate phosphoribosyltransferase [Candidiatus Paracoxiella cheracis]|uniref:nicotinate phosphoribosyltransferase n=1 Tax=Candidiatus Paracoxiella cheracis TaxID=3405120 RepID=UPI003BF5589A
MSEKHNLILNTDSYKASHYLQYPPNTSQISCYIESRGGKYPQTLFFGLQMYLKEYLSKPITRENIDEAEDFLRDHGLPFNREGWEHILKKHGGYLPIAIEAVPEGTVMPLHNVMAQVGNTDPECFWLTTYIETSLLRAVWYPTTVATSSWHCKEIIRRYLLETAESLDGLPFKLHDFGARGVSSQESAEIGGAAHLVNFAGTDTLAGIIAAQRYYSEPMAAYSIPAAEHSTIVTWGKNNESEAYKHILKQFSKKNQMISIVSDAYDIWHALNDIWGDELKQQVVDNPGVLVIRPDSGDPATIVTKTIEILMAKFGSTINSKGYHVLPNNLRIIQGDGVNIKTIASCLDAMKAKKQSAENIAFGMGGALLQKLDRDTQEFAMKPNAIERDGQWFDVYKTPKTDMSKESKPGRLALIHDDREGFKTIRIEELGNRENILIPIFKDGKLLKEWSFKEIRDRSETFL